MREILSVYRAEEPETDNPRFQKARAEAERDPELAQWWSEEQELDRVIAAKLQSAEVPRNLKAQLMGGEKRTTPRHQNRGLLLAAASIVALAVLFGSWRGPFQPAASLADYRDEMVSFVKLDPALELKSSEMSRVTEFLKAGGAPSQIVLPRPLQQLEPVGCRTLRFRGADVALICFRNEGGLVHLFVIERKQMAKLRSGKKPDVAALRDWTTATWVDGDFAYLLASKTSRAALEKILGTS